ncbi:MAG: class I SAM-dependent rRNA methyltransferase [Leptospirales bacterium]|nr:class I SAM-dependent rRNA methyltransferase [Leptospirales bacterium]
MEEPGDAPPLILRPGRERSILDRHPWIFSGAVRRSPPAADGAIVAVQSAEGKSLGYGFFHPEASLACRMFLFGEGPLPPINELWQSRLTRALQFRQAQPDHQPRAFRLCNAESDGLPGLIVDILGACAAVQFRESAMISCAQTVVEFLRGALAIDCILDRSGEERRTEKRTQSLFGPTPDEIVIEENGFRYLLDLLHTQKTGFYLDQKENRKIFERYASGRRTLDAFCYSGSFSLHALRGGASAALSLDASPRALEDCQRNVRENFGDESRHHVVRADALAWLRESAESFDLISLDPPAFARTRAALDQALRGYREINLQALRRLAPGGFLFTYSCSQYVTPDLFQKVLFQAARDSGREARVIQRLTAAADHPFSLFHPEGEYLKGLLIQVD